MDQASTAEVVTDPVGHISISGVHGRSELDERLAHAGHVPARDDPRVRTFGAVLVGAVIGAAIVYFLKRG